MCIIVAKPTGVELPLTETLNNCVTSNRNGIGFSYSLPGQKPIINKGFFVVKTLEKAMNECGITPDHNLIIHFRFATHGKTDQGNCHPFPITDDFKSMRLLDCECECSVAHNGVFGSMPKHNQHSDTMKFISGILATPEIIGNLESKSVKELIRGYCGFGSKLAFLRRSGLTLIGDFEEDKGIYYSNTQFKGWSVRKGSYTYDPNEYWDQISQTWKTKEKVSCCATVDNKEKRIELDFKEKQKCLWCTVSLDVFYSSEAGGYLCQECSDMLDDYGNKMSIMD